MEYMEAQMQQAMEMAQENYRRDATFRRFVDMAVHQAMRHFEQFDRSRGDEIDKRDVHHVAIAAALAALHIAVESDEVLKQLTVERDHYKELATKGLNLFPQAIVRSVPD